jgi:hypothetical protein
MGGARVGSHDEGAGAGDHVVPEALLKVACALAARAVVTEDGEGVDRDPGCFGGGPRLCQGRAARVPGTVSRKVDDLAVPGEPVRLDQADAVDERRADGVDAVDGARRGEKASGGHGGRGGTVDHDPVENDNLPPGASPFDVGERDPPVDPAGADGGDDVRVHERGRVAATLDAELHVVNRTRRIG